MLSIDGLSHIPEIYNQFYNSLRTNVHVIDLIPLAPTAAQAGIDPTRIRHFSVTRDMAEFWRTPGGASVLLPSRDAIRAMLTEAFGPQIVASAE